MNLAHDPRVAVTIQEDYSDWLEIKGVQLEGVASEISGAELPCQALHLDIRRKGRHRIPRFPL